MGNFGLDGKHVLTASNGRLTAELRHVDGKFTNAVFSRDGRHIITASETGKIRVWNSDSLSQLITKGCSWLSNYLKNVPDLSEDDRRLCDDVTATAPKSK